MKASRIAVLLQSLEGGGAQRRVVELANGFVREGRSVDLFVEQMKGDLHDQLSSQVRLQTADKLAHDLRNEPPDALLSGASAVHRLAVRSLPPVRGFPLILRASSHPYRNLPWSMPYKRLIEQFRRRRRIQTYAAADLIIAVAADVAEALKAVLPAQCINVIPNQVVTKQFLAGASVSIDYPWSDSPSVPLIVGVGRLALAKDFPTLLRAFALVRKSHAVRLAILGDGSEAERGALLHLAKDLRVERDFHLVGNCDHVAAWLSRATMFVSSSLWEGSPATIIEALAMGCPLIATDSVGTAREILTDRELGSLVPPRRPDLMAEAIATWLYRDHDKTRARAAALPYSLERTNDYLAAIDNSRTNFL